MTQLSETFRVFSLCLLNLAQPLPSPVGEGDGVCVVLTANGDTDPTPAPPLEGRGVQRMIYAIYRTYPKKESFVLCG